ncbi:MAG: clostripain-related cysteine peptidase [Parabacteroides sp.]|nr:clostripain-related cysteine peptidase [Parabacteroides sp.]
MKFKIIALFAVLCLGFASCSDDKEIPEPQPTRTILVYMMANNSLDSYASKNIQSMIAGATNQNLNGGNLIVYYAPRGSNPELLQIKEENGVVNKFHIKDYDKQNSADPDVMLSVIKEVTTQYKADSYGLILWSHGTAWLPSDYQNMLMAFGQDGSNWLEIDDLAKGLPDNLFDFILFDACYMASVECTYELRNKADYILASSTETMADGWPYTQMMPQLFASNLQLDKVGETFYNYYLNDSYPYATVSLTKTSELGNLKNAVHDILAGKTESDIYGINLSEMQRLEYLYASPGMLYDMADYMKQLATDEQYSKFTDCLEKAVVYKAHTPKSYYYYGYPSNALPVNSYCGLTAFVPQPKQSFSKIFDWYKARVSWYKAVYE